MRKLSLADLVLTAAFTALLAILSQFAIPMPSGVPATLQTFAVALCGFVLGAKRGAVSIAVYLLLGAVGLPVFAGFSGGIGMFLGYTGGFLWGFFALVTLSGTGSLFLSALGLILCHALGIAQFSLVSGSSLAGSALVASVPFLLKDGASVVLAYFAGKAVRRGLAAARTAPGR